jgi:DNA (cytosine-5)-methyltransferase 1
MTQNGQVFELPMQVHLTTDSEFSSSPILRTPAASEAERGHQPEDKSRARGGQVTLSGQMMTYFPTPNTMDHLPARTPEQKEANKGKGGYANVRETVINDLLRTPNAMDGDKGSYATASERLQQGRQVNLHNEINEIGTNWGKFEPAIRRWEEVLGRPAPAPTKPDGKEGAHRLSSAFTEWMMGLPEGWITDVGLSRNDELKACGNGVVPQQAELALRVLLEGVPLPAVGGQVNLPTPTVSDTYTDNLASSQQKPGSMHSVTLPQAVRWVAGD